MLDNTIALLDESIEDETPALPTGATMFWKDDQGDWHDVEVIDCEPIGWGWCNIRYSNFDGRKVTTKSVPIITLCDLDAYLDQQPDIVEFEAATKEHRNRRATGALGYIYQ